MLDPQIHKKPEPLEQQMTVVLRRSKRRRKLSSKYPKEDDITMTDNGEPQNIS